ncbi:MULTISPECIES: DinB family protein [Sphingobacterium]|nr:DinB family protein [Sphingobacterium siyangense]
MPRAGAIRFIVNNHIGHHRGQLTVYLRLLDIAVPGLYAPSADEGMSS